MIVVKKPIIHQLMRMVMKFEEVNLESFFSQKIFLVLVMHVIFSLMGIEILMKEISEFLVNGHFGLSRFY